MVEGESGRAGIRVWVMGLELPFGRSERQHLEGRRGDRRRSKVNLRFRRGANRRKEGRKGKHENAPP